MHPDNDNPLTEDESLEFKFVYNTFKKEYVEKGGLMKIKSTMIQSKQDVINKFYDGMTFIIENFDKLGIAMLAYISVMNAGKILSGLENGVLRLSTKFLNASNLFNFKGTGIGQGFKNFGASFVNVFDEK